jgi:hypothetical protein
VQGSDLSYDGHRLQADKNIAQAIDKLTPVRPGDGPNTNNSIVTPASEGSGGSGAAPKLMAQSQEESDALMQNAIQVLDQTYKMIQTDHPDAATDVEVAIKELKAALNVQ